MELRIDLNVDVGEAFGAWRIGDDAALLDLVTTANVACGFHAGDAPTMRRTCAAAHKRGVRIGAHVGFPDLAGFGRREMGLSPAEIADCVVYQIGALLGCARSVGATVTHLKPHGALYHRACGDPAAAKAVAEGTSAVDPNLVVVGLPDSALHDAASAIGLVFVAEGFVDRVYADSDALVDRVQMNGLLDPAAAAEQAVALASGADVRTAADTLFAPCVDSICLHGDAPRAVETARTVRAALSAAGIELAPFA